jgi:hypothetical protein
MRKQKNKGSMNDVDSTVHAAFMLEHNPTAATIDELSDNSCANR